MPAKVLDAVNKHARQPIEQDLIPHSTFWHPKRGSSARYGGIERTFFRVIRRVRGSDPESHKERCQRANARKYVGSVGPSPVRIDFGSACPAPAWGSR